VFISFFFTLKVKLKDFKFEFYQFKLNIITGKFAINLKNFARVRLQLKFAFVIRPSISYGYETADKCFKKNFFEKS